MAELSASGFLARWARRKALARIAGEVPREDGDEVAPPPAAKAGEPVPDEVPPGEEMRDDARAVPVLPDIDSLTRDSDFSVFMAQGVPVELRNRALRKLWRLDPVFANLDGLNDYDGDYTDAAVATGVVRTAYRVGRGFLDQVDAGKEEGTGEGKEKGEPEAGTEMAEAEPDPGADEPGRPESAEGEADAPQHS